MRESGDGVFGRRRRNRRECKSAQTSVEAAEPGDALSATPPRAGSAQERPRETKRLFGHREIPQPEEHGPDLCSGHRAPTRTQEIQDVVAVVFSRSSTVRTKDKLLLLGLFLSVVRVCFKSAMKMGVVRLLDAPRQRSPFCHLFLTLRRLEYAFL